MSLILERHNPEFCMFHNIHGAGWPLEIVRWQPIIALLLGHSMIVPVFLDPTTLRTLRYQVKRKTAIRSSLGFSFKTKNKVPLCAVTPSNG